MTLGLSHITPWSQQVASLVARWGHKCSKEEEIVWIRDQAQAEFGGWLNSRCGGGDWSITRSQGQARELRQEQVLSFVAIYQDPKTIMFLFNLVMVWTAKLRLYPKTTMVSVVTCGELGVGMIMTNWCFSSSWRNSPPILSLVPSKWWPSRVLDVDRSHLGILHQSLFHYWARASLSAMSHHFHLVFVLVKIAPVAACSQVTKSCCPRAYLGVNCASLNSQNM